MKKKLFLLLAIQFVAVLGFSQTTTYGTSSGAVGARNSFFGYNAGTAITTSGVDNSYFGHLAGYQTTSGSQNCFFGSYAGQYTTTGTHNVSIGYSSGSYITSGIGNVSLGTSTNGATTTGNYNTYIGYYSGRFNNTGVNNVGLGYFAGFHFTSGYKNLALGDNAGYNATTGNSNVFVGSSSGYSNVTGTGNVFIGANAGYNELGSNKLYIDNTNTTTPLIYGDFSARTLNITANSFTVNGSPVNGSQWATSGTNINYVGAGVVSIGTTSAPSGYKLAVGGKMIAEELVIKLQPWPDFVFKSDYDLLTLAELQAYIKVNNHLPGVPSAKEVENDGVAIGEMNSILLRKIEELTLYMLQQQKEIDLLKTEVSKSK